MELQELPLAAFVVDITREDIAYQNWVPASKRGACTCDLYAGFCQDADTERAFGRGITHALGIAADLVRAGRTADDLAGSEKMSQRLGE